MKYFVYLIISKNKQKYLSYVGYTNNLKERLAKHNTSKGAKFTRGRKWKVIYKEFFSSKNKAISKEYYLNNNRTLRNKIKLLPDGSYRNDVILPLIPGCNDKIEIKTLVTVSNDEIIIDYTGSSGEIRAAVNCSYNMTRSYTSYPIKIALDPTIPNNDGRLRPIKVIAPEGSIVNSRPPAATWGRTMI